MGDYANAMLDGTLCMGCGVFLGSDLPGYCSDCKKENRADKHAKTLAGQQLLKKAKCSECGRRVKAVGMADHLRDAHGITPNVKLTGGALAPSSDRRERG